MDVKILLNAFRIFFLFKISVFNSPLRKDIPIMDPIRARRLAENLIPNAPVKHEDAADLGITRQHIRQIDNNPADGALSQDELYQALLNNQVDVDESTGRITRASAAVSFVDPVGPPTTTRDLFPGYFTQGVRDPHSQPLQGARPGSYTPPAGMGLDELSSTLTTPEEVTKLLQPFGSAVYDYDRADNGSGPSGTQTPRETLENYSGICRDSHQLAAYVLNQNGYDAVQVGYKTQGVLHAVTSYQDKDSGGYGIIEYGTHYSAESIAEILGRPALSHEEALLAVRPEAKFLNQYSAPEADQQGHIEGLYYTMGHMLYQETLRLNHENRVGYDQNRGLELEAALGEHWGIKLNVDTGNSPDPTARESMSAAIGYQTGTADNGFRISTGFQYRPNEGHHSVGGNNWESHPAMVIGGQMEGRVTPFTFQLGENHQTRTYFSGSGTVAVALSQGEGTDGTGQSSGGGWSYDTGLSLGLTHATVRAGQEFRGQLSDNFSYTGELFIEPDILAMSMGYGTGGSGIYANSGANATLHYQNGNWGAHLGGQYLFTQVNNLEASGVSTGLSYASGPFRAGANFNLLDSNEGLRMTPSATVGLDLTEDIGLNGFVSHEIINNKDFGTFTNPGGTNFGVNLTARF